MVVASATGTLVTQLGQAQVLSRLQRKRTMKMLTALLLSLMPASALAQTSEDAHVQHMGRLADAALNAQYRSTMATMAQADTAREADLRNGSSKPDGRPTYQGALVAAERAWLGYRDAHCESVGLAFRGGAYEDEAEGKCVNDMARRRTIELKELSNSMNR